MPNASRRSTDETEGMMTFLHIFQTQFMGIAALGTAAILAAIALSAVLQLSGDVGREWTPARTEKTVRHALEGIFTALLSPILALVVGIFLATTAPAALFMIPFFLVWATRHHNEDAAHVRHYARAPTGLGL
jgi:hypothetical protein